MSNVKWGDIVIVLWLMALTVTVACFRQSVEYSADDIVNAINARQCDHTCHPPVVEIGEVK